MKSKERKRLEAILNHKVGANPTNELESLESGLNEVQDVQIGFAGPTDEMINFAVGGGSLSEWCKMKGEVFIGYDFDKFRKSA